MLRSYIKIARRNLVQNKGYSAITILGLGLGLAIVLLIGLYVADELRFDRFNQKADRIYRINSDISFSQQGLKSALSPTPMGHTLKQEFPEVEQAVRLGRYGTFLVRGSRESIRESGVLFTDSTLFDVFTLPMLAGNARTALAQPQSVVITENTARKYFGTTDALNRILTFNNTDPRRVTGVIKGIPAQSHFQADFLLPLYETKDAKANKWGNHMFTTYVLLRPGTDPAAVESKFEHILQTYLDPALRQFFNTSLAETRKAGNYFRYSLLPLRDIHLHSARDGELMPTSNVAYVYILVGIALFILLIAVFNFINLATARSVKRAREVGVRKVLGSSRTLLLAQFLSESTLIACIALLVALGLAGGVLPYFNTLVAKTLSITEIATVPIALLLVLGTLLIGVLAGAYPAFYLSSFQPARAVKGQEGIFSKRQGLRSSLVVFQFSLSVLLIIGTLLVHQQLRYIQTKKLGFTREQVLVVKTPQATEGEVHTFKEEALRDKVIRTASISGFLPVTSHRNGDYWYPERQTNQKSSVPIQEWQVDEDYMATFGMKLVQGRNFIKGKATDAEGIIINESAAKRLGYQNPVGKTLHKQGGEQLTIIGVVQNFHYESLRSAIEPVGLVLSGSVVGSEDWDAVSFRLMTGNVSDLLTSLEKTWKQVAPNRPFAYSFLDDDFDAMYRTEQRIEQLVTIFAGIAIFIACLGLFGLSAFTAEQRQKEIGVRKVLGATIVQVVTLLSKDFLKPVLIAIGIASPIAYWAMTRWLQEFAYKIDIEWRVFALAGVLAMGIALFTVSFQSIKAALMNPVKSLKME